MDITSCTARKTNSSEILTVSLSSIMVCTYNRATTDAPVTALIWLLDGGYDVFARFTSGNVLPILATKPRGSYPREETYVEPLAKDLCAEDEPASIFLRRFPIFSISISVRSPVYPSEAVQV